MLSVIKRYFYYLAVGLVIQAITACQTPKAESQQTDNYNQSQSKNQQQQTNLI